MRQNQPVLLADQQLLDLVVIDTHLGIDEDLTRRTVDKHQAEKHAQVDKMRSRH